jgi:hypothetical protein
MMLAYEWFLAQVAVELPISRHPSRKFSVFLIMSLGYLNFIYIFVVVVDDVLTDLQFVLCQQHIKRICSYRQTLLLRHCLRALNGRHPFKQRIGNTFIFDKFMRSCGGIDARAHLFERMHITCAVFVHLPRVHVTFGLRVAQLRT